MSTSDGWGSVARGCGGCLMGWEGLGACKVPAPEVAMSLSSRLSDGSTDELDIHDYVNICIL